MRWFQVVDFGLKDRLNHCHSNCVIIPFPAVFKDELTSWLIEQSVQFQSLLRLWLGRGIYGLFNRTKESSNILLVTSRFPNISMDPRENLELIPFRHLQGSFRIGWIRSSIFVQFFDKLPLIKDPAALHLLNSLWSDGILCKLFSGIDR